MKNLLEELRNLDNEEEIEVPADFRERVIDSITNEDNSNKLRYIMPVCGVAAAFLIAIVVGENVRNNSNDYIMDSSEPNYIMAEGYEVDNYAEESGEVSSANTTGEMNAKSANEAMLDSVEAARSNDSEYYDEIVSMLKINNIEAEKINGAVRAKGKKEVIEDALYYFEDNIEMKQDGEYIIIKVK